MIILTCETKIGHMIIRIDRMTVYRVQTDLKTNKRKIFLIDFLFCLYYRTLMKICMIVYSFFSISDLKMQ